MSEGFQEVCECEYETTKCQVTTSGYAVGDRAVLKGDVNNRTMNFEVDEKLMIVRDDNDVKDDEQSVKEEKNEPHGG